MNLRPSARTPALVGVGYLNGTILFVAGLAIVRHDNRRSGGWPVLVTLTSWLAILGGLLRMVAPAATQSAAD